MSCNSCGENNHVGSCENPCRRGPHNSAQCESLPSALDNFTKQFFGVVTKSEVNGQVVWTLPCNLDVGLPNNPRQENEGAACYFLRLFGDGILGLTGPKGDSGNPGANGNNAYTVTLHGFTQPGSGNPNIQIVTAFNPAILSDSYVFVQGSGYYFVTDADTTGTLFLQLVQPVSGVSGTVTAGKLVTVSGPPGQAITGPTGPQGPVGPQGPTGNTATNDNGFYFTTTGTDYTLTAVYAAVDFTTSSPAVLLPNAGKYLMTVVATIAGLGGVATTDAALLKLRNTTTAADVSGSIMSITNLVPDQFTQIVINVIVTTITQNNTVALYGRASGGGIIDVVANNTTVSFVQIA